MHSSPPQVINCHTHGNLNNTSRGEKEITRTVRKMDNSSQVCRNSSESEPPERGSWNRQDGLPCRRHTCYACVCNRPLSD